MLSLLLSLSLIYFVTSDCVTHTVVAGDTCYDLATKYNASLSQITDSTDGGKLCANSRMWVGDILQICNGPAPPPASGGGVLSILTEGLFDSMFPRRNTSRYSYSNLVSASQRGFVGAFCNGNDQTANKRELAMFFS